MAKKLTDLSQLTKAILKESPPPRPVEKPAPEPSQSREDADAAAVLAYFSRTPQNAPQRNRAASCAVSAKDRPVASEAELEAKDAALAALVEEKAAQDERIAELERQLAEARETHEAAVRERDRLQGECGRLQGELRKRDENAPVSARVVAAPVAKDEPTKPTQLSPEASAEPRSGRYAGCILVAPGAVVEVFTGEVREQVVATLLDGLGTAERSGRERRAEILRYVLGEKQSHWIWYVFPQLKGLGMSWTSEFYGIADLDEARAYLAHPVLGARLREISAALLRHRQKSARAILGYPDDLKVCSSMTLFDLIEPNGVFAEVLDVFYGGKRDAKTLELLNR